MSQSQSQKRPTCHCGSRVFRKDAKTGKIVCAEGHVLLNYVQESHEREYDPSHVHRARKLRKNKKKKIKTDSSNYAGDKARCLQFECAQILLRQQVAILISHWDLPKEFETVTRDLWGLYTTASNLPEAFPGPDTADEPPPPLQIDQTDIDDVEAAYDYSSSSDEGPSEHSEQENTDQEPEKIEKPRRKLKTNATKITNPAKVFHAYYTIVICYLACLKLKVPIFVNDLLLLAGAGTLPYLRFADSLPESLQRVLPPPVFDALNPKVLPDLVGHENHALSAWINRFVDLYAGFEIEFPEREITPSINRCIQTILLPSWFQHPVKHLLERINADFHYSSRDHTGDRVKGTYRQTKLYTNPVNTYMVQDAVIAAACATCCKLVYGLDGRSRAVFGHSKAVAALPDFNDWQKELSLLCGQEPAEIPAFASSQSISQIDAYLDRAESLLPNTTIDDQATTEDVRPSLISAAFERLAACPRIRASATEDGLLSGHAIPVYKVNATGQGALPPSLTLVLSRLSKLVGVTNEILLKCVIEIEMRMASRSWFADDTEMGDNHVDSHLEGDPSNLDSSADIFDQMQL